MKYKLNVKRNLYKKNYLGQDIKHLLCCRYVKNIGTVVLASFV